MLNKGCGAEAQQKLEKGWAPARPPAPRPPPSWKTNFIKKLITLLTAPILMARHVQLKAVIIPTYTTLTLITDFLLENGDFKRLEKSGGNFQLNPEKRNGYTLER